MAKVIIIFGYNKHIKDFFFFLIHCLFGEKNHCLFGEKKIPLQCAETNRKYCKGDI